MNLQFHWYGFFVGLALVLGWWLVDDAFQKEVAKRKIVQKNTSQLLQSAWILVGVGVFLGARLWHVFTDWQLYQNNLSQILAVWQGGLSIVGAVMGGVFGFVAWWWFFAKKQNIAGLFLDSFAWSLPIAQAIGRMGNFVNQELYGWPTLQPWGIFISPEKRVVFLETQSMYHPLFAYEAIAMLFFWVVIFFAKEKIKKYFGTGLILTAYVTYYSLLRYSLDWFRPDRTHFITFFGASVGINQMVMVLWLVVSLGWWMYQVQQKKIQGVLTLMVIGLSLILLITSTVFGSQYAVEQQQKWFTLEQKQLGQAEVTLDQLKNKDFDNEFITLRFSQPNSGSETIQTLRVEVVNSPETMSQGLSDRDSIGSDGMLFVFPQQRMVNFWMRRMHFNLDMVWIKNNKVISITPNVPTPPPNTPTGQLPTYSPPETIDMVLELPAGMAEQLNLKPGQELQFEQAK